MNILPKAIPVLALAVMSAVAQARTAETADMQMTPPGITLQVLGKGQGYDLGKAAAAAIARDQIAFADAKGLTLYTYAQDPAGASACTGDCAKIWLPLIAGKNAKAYGPWSLIKRADGARQWAYKGKALYSFTKDVDPGSVGGNSPARFGARRKNGAGEYVGGGVRGAGARNAAPDVPLPEGWSPALAYPADLQTPPGMAVKEIPDALGLVLVNHRNHALYAFDGAPDAAAKACAAPCVWEPASAPQLAEARGDFSLIARKDGVRQWAYQGHALYTYTGDLSEGVVNGAGVDKRWTPATVVNYFMPPGVASNVTPGQGRVLSTAAGMTLYRRDGYIFQSGGGHSLRRGQPARPAVGRDIGVNAHCDDACAKLWKPLAAPSDAQPQGLWSIYTRADGAKQWAYQGYALWTYAGDARPGDINGNDVLDIRRFADSAGMTANVPRQAFMDVGTPMDGAAGLYWAIAVP